MVKLNTICNRRIDMYVVISICDGEGLLMFEDDTVRVTVCHCTLDIFPMKTQVE